MYGQPLVEKFEAKMVAGKGISFGGCLILVNTILFALPLYYISIFKLPSWVLRKIDCIHHSFLQNAFDSTCGLTYKVNWERICLPKDEGGLGVKDLKAFNLILANEAGEFLTRMLALG